MLKTSVSPHVHARISIEKSMWNVNVALIPAFLAAIYFFGPVAIRLSFVSILTALVSELIMQLLLKKDITITDGSAFLTGLLVAFNVPPGTPLYVPVVGSFFAIVIVKHLFGGLGNNIFNPALAGRVFIMFAWLPEMTTWNVPLDPQWLNNPGLVTANLDTITAATPLAIEKLKGMKGVIEVFGTKELLYHKLFTGNVGGCLGETSAFALLIGGVYLGLRKIINPFIPVVYIATVYIITGLAGHDPVFHILAGGLFLGAIYMATDYVTSPFTKTGMFIYALGCGLVTSLLRLKGGLPEGVSFSILLMNAFTPLIDRYSKTKVYGTGKK